MVYFQTENYKKTHKILDEIILTYLQEHFSTVAYYAVYTHCENKCHKNRLAFDINLSVLKLMYFGPKI